MEAMKAVKMYQVSLHGGGRGGSSTVLLTGNSDGLVSVPLSPEVRQLAVEVAAVVERHVDEAQLRHRRVDDRHRRRPAVAFIVVPETDRRTVVAARV